MSKVVTLQIAGQAARPTPNDALALALHTLRSWQTSQPLPERVTAGEIQSAHQMAQAMLIPAGPKGATVAMERLFTMLPMPDNEAAMPIWIEMLSPYPGDVLMRAVDVVIRRHKWETPPKVAEVIEAIGEDRAYRDRLAAKGKLETALMYAKWRDEAEQGRTPGPPVSPDRVKALLASYSTRRGAGEKRT